MIDLIEYPPFVMIFFGVVFLFWMMFVLKLSDHRQHLYARKAARPPEGGVPPNVVALLDSHARMLADLDDVIAHALRVRADWADDMPHLFAVPAGRRITDAPPALDDDGLAATDCAGVLKGNTDIRCDRLAQ